VASYPKLDPEAAAILKQGVVIPAHPLALNAHRKFDERRQAALTRYYCDAGAGGIAAGVHTTQFAIRDPQFGLFEPVLNLVASTARQCERASGKRIVKIAGVCGQTGQAVREARFAREAGFDLGLLSLAAMGAAGDPELKPLSQSKSRHSIAIKRSTPFGEPRTAAVPRTSRSTQEMTTTLSRICWPIFA
jgi:hypothetical protein